MSPCVAVLQPLHQTAQARVDLGRVHTKGFTCTTSVSCWAKPLKQTIQCLDRGFHGGHWQNEGYDSILFNPGDGGDQASISFSKIFICQICQICQVPNTYVMWCHVCHVIWKNDFWRLGIFGVKPPIVWMANEVNTWFGTRTACWVCAVCETVSSGWFNWQAVAIPRKKGVCAWGWMHVRYVRSATECFFFGTCSGLETVEMDLGSMQWGSKSWWSIRNQILASLFSFLDFCLPRRSSSLMSISWILN